MRYLYFNTRKGDCEEILARKLLPSQKIGETLKASPAKRFRPILNGLKK
jgi:hypothetical protein